MAAVVADFLAHVWDLIVKTFNNLKLIKLIKDRYEERKYGKMAEMWGHWTNSAILSGGGYNIVPTPEAGSWLIRDLMSSGDAERLEKQTKAAEKFPILYAQEAKKMNILQRMNIKKTGMLAIAVKKAIAKRS